LSSQLDFFRLFLKLTKDVVLKEEEPYYSSFQLFSSFSIHS